MAILVLWHKVQKQLRAKHHETLCNMPHAACQYYYAHRLVLLCFCDDKFLVAYYIYFTYNLKSCCSPWNNKTISLVEVDDLAWDCSNFIAKALELLQSRAKPPKWCNGKDKVKKGSHQTSKSNNGNTSKINTNIQYACLTWTKCYEMELLYG